MNKILLFLFYPFLLFAFTISLNSGIENKKSYSVLKISDDKEFECVEQILAYNTKRYACMLDDNGMMDIQDVELDLMDINYKKQDGKFFIVVLPKANSRLINTENKLYFDTNVKTNKSKTSKQFDIVVDPNLKEFDETLPNGVNFAPNFDLLLRPNIGALDFNKAPIEGFDSNDIDIYIGIKKSYDNQSYNKVIDDTQIAIQRHPKSIFAGEFLLYRLRAMDKIFETKDEYEELTPENIIQEGKAWMRKFVSDDNYPEVLYMVVRAYIKDNIFSDAKYMIDILLNEHPKSIFTSLAILDYADAVYNNGKDKDALKLYENVLYATDNIDIASRAALSLTNKSIEKEKIQDAKKYVLKILNSNNDYFLKDKQKAFDLAGAFVRNKMPEVSAKIYEILVKNIEKRDRLYEVSLKNLGIELAKDNQTKEAYKYLNKYQDEFKYGDYVSQVQTAMDNLFFKLDENNATKLREHYKELMKKYQNADIGKKALLSLMDLNIKERKFKQNLEYAVLVKDLNQTKGIEYLNTSAFELAKEGIRQNDCQDVVNLIENYDVNRLELSQFKLYECLNRTARFKDALNLAQTHIYDNDLEDRVEWLVNLSDSYYKTKDYENSIKAANDAISLGAGVEHSDPTPALFFRFYSLLELNRFSEAIATLQVMDEIRGQDFKLIEAYDKVSKYAFYKNDFANANIYSKKALELQNGVRINTFTPELNFIYASSSLKLDHISDALDEAKYILSLRLKPEERSRALNLISTIYIQQKKPQLAKQYLIECINTNIQSSYKSLCEAQLNLIK
ncbi:flagellar protein [Campylobacter pinnipediorum subsp. caledonicus]|uniref:tetratricopeptide repeat protein n=1 Tax=Campylobacter pinnipediorum TaxID=1965231 RepID=UPI000995B0D1|nr:flagellar protein [Campylobacter pinnipediorum]OPA72667.1 flagellar protein [Campylobacter pinnipediorum subsp. caledonicus]